MASGLLCFTVSAKASDAITIEVPISDTETEVHQIQEPTKGDIIQPMSVEVIQSEEQSKTAAARSLNGVRLKSSNAYPIVPARGKTKAVTSVSDFDGEYILCYYNIVDDDEYHDGGNVVTIAPVTGTDSISITNFWEDGAVVKAKIDISAMTISIPNQVIGSNTSYGDYDIASYDSSSEKPVRSTEITGTISSEGAITIDGDWGVFVTSGSNADNYFALYNNTTIEAPNGKMIYTTYDYTLLAGVVDTAKVALTYNADGNLVVKNFFNKGVPLVVTLCGSKKSIIHYQFVYVDDYDNDPVYTYGAVYSSNYTVMDSRTTAIICDVATDLRTISWGEWAIMYGYVVCVTGIDGRIEADFDITYPDALTFPLSGEGTAESPYMISTATEWNAFSDYMVAEYMDYSGSYIKLAADIDFSETAVKPLGYDGLVSFGGDFDGDGKTIKGFTYTTTMSYSGGLFCDTNSGANIHDFAAEGEVTSQWSGSGGVLGRLYYSTMSNVTGSVKVTANNPTGYSYSSVGGVIGLTTSSTVTGCVNNGAVTSDMQYTGGVTGYLYNSSLTDCTNNGFISGANTNVAGIVGWTFSSTIANCVNTSDINNSGDYTGGIIGHPLYYNTIDSCYNSGDINAGGYAGGIIGYLGSYSTLSNSVNTGNVTFTYRYTGGVVGFDYASTMTNCVNYGKVSSSHNYCGGVVGTVYTSTSSGLTNYGDVENTSTDGTYLGGVAGQVYKSGTLSDSYNYGNVTSSALYTGGVAGIVNSTSTLSSSASFGPVSTTGDYTAGVASATNGGTVTGCYNVADVTSTGNYAGGVLGVSNSSSDNIINSYNLGDVSATGSYVGGVCGSITGYVNNVYCAGNVSGGSYVGGMAGTVASGAELLNGYISGTVTAGSLLYGDVVATNSGTVSGTYYLAANSAGTGSVGTALTYAGLGSLELTGWTNGDDYTYPRLADNDYAKAFAAAVIPADGDSYSSITQSFSVGTPEGVTWTASTDAISFDGNTATFTATVDGTVTLTATCGEASATTEVTCSVEVEGIDGVSGDMREVVTEKCYNISGIQVAEPGDDVKAIYIVVRTYNDGTTSVSKQVR